MLRSNNSTIRAAFFAAVVLVVALSASLGSRLPLGSPATAKAARPAPRQSVAEQLPDQQAQLELVRHRKLVEQKPALVEQKPAPVAAAGPIKVKAPAAPPSVPAIIEAAFSAQGATAVQWGLCIASHESGDNPAAVQIGGGGALGLFQFEPGTWAATPQGEAGESVFDATAAAQAAAWMYGLGEYDAWSTNEFCGQYD